nr:immunoglobulin heavy chain junction region [Mus musculus]
CARGRLLDYW